MNICYLILAHNNFDHLNRMIDSLNDSDENSFYIHIDKKVSQYTIQAQDNIHIIPTRIDINWGGYTMIEATLALIEYAIESSPKADYYILISGVDYPIRKKSFLLEQLEKGKEYIDIAPVPAPFKPILRYEYFYFDYNRRNLKPYNPLFLTEVLLKKLKIKRKAPFKLYAGTQWFALTNKCIQYILKIVEEDKRYEQFFKHTLVPDEAFFQTIIGNSPFMEHTAASLTYTDWEVENPPAIIEERHIEFLKKTIEFNDEYRQRFPYFARKFDNNSKEITEKIKKELWL
ncbi:beta-1,6-N-acetylglucosaminyltransferase [Dysgonomonas sp. Marseille-P4361]|uniref:beta-1,6-N-acetylglucosaminyltransferase n=1 Tax=Dysgonomonas sp. Marseille-P4361 TaxID=2161820 RepID=UPI000D54E788|nr:beta-1,6-N-acetylglucosaminyltransferase [Dysgonomonas sp. Marseille-P4361]